MNKVIFICVLLLNSVASHADVCKSTKYELNKETIWIFDIEEPEVEFNLRRRSDSVLNDYDFRINCFSQKYTDNKTGYFLDTKADGNIENLIVSSCAKARLFIANKPPSCLTNAKSDSTQLTNKIEKVTNTKKICSELGFKPKTEKFGKCVLELTK